MDWITTEGDFRFVAGIDFETTGLNANIDRIVQAGVACFDGPVLVNESESFVNADGTPISSDAALINNITESDIEDAPTFTDTEPTLRETTKGRVVVGHRLMFDAQLRAASCRRNGLVPPRRSGLCPKVLARAAGHTEGLARIGDRYGMPSGCGHEALNDTKMCARVAMRAVPDLGGITTACEQHRLFATQQLGWVFANPSEADTETYRRAHGSLAS